VPFRRLSRQQIAVLEALREQSPTPTTILRDVRSEYFYANGRSAGSWKIGEPVGAVLRRLEKRGLVTGEMGSDCKDWWISDAGLEALESG
jgi:hypothetical protein